MDVNWDDKQAEPLPTVDSDLAPFGSAVVYIAEAAGVAAVTSLVWLWKLLLFDSKVVHYCCWCWAE